MFLTKNPTIFPAVTDYSQMSPDSGSYFFLILAKWSKYTQTSICSFINLISIKSTPLQPIISARRCCWNI